MTEEIKGTVNNPVEIEITLEQALEGDSVKYRYTHEEQSVDIRTWTVESDVSLTDEQVGELCSEHGYAEGQVAHLDTSSVEYHGTEYGDDSQINTYCTKGN